MRPTLVLVLGVAGSIALTIALSWWLPGLWLFLFLPFFALPFIRIWSRQQDRSPVRAGDGPPGALRTCPKCGHVGAGPDRFCPRDGSRLQ